jgi:hypothetical protein
MQEARSGLQIEKNSLQRLTPIAVFLRLQKIKNKQITARVRARAPAPAFRLAPAMPPLSLLLPAARLAGVVSASGGSRPAPQRRSKSGFSRRSAIKKSFHQEQVVFATPVPDDPAVAVIGGGASGLACASALAARGVRAVVFDTVRLALARPLSLSPPRSPH